MAVKSKDNQLLIESSLIIIMIAAKRCKERVLKNKDYITEKECYAYLNHMETYISHIKTFIEDEKQQKEE